MRSASGTPEEIRRKAAQGEQACSARRNSSDSDSARDEIHPGDSLADKLLEALRQRRTPPSTRRHPRRETQNRLQIRRPRGRSDDDRTIRRIHCMGEAIRPRRPRHRTRPAREPRRDPPQERRAHHRDASRLSLRQQRRRCLQRQRRESLRCCCRKIPTGRPPTCAAR